MLRSTTWSVRAIAPRSDRSRLRTTGTSSRPIGPAASLTTRFEKPSHYLLHKTAQEMLPDIVIDTNVLCHADNPYEPRCAASRMLVLRLLEVPAQLCVDEGF